MEETNNQNDNMDVNNDVDNVDESSDIDYDDDKWSVEFDKDIFHGLKKNASTITDVSIDCYHSSFHSIDWRDDGDCIANNTHLKMLRMYGLYILREQNNELPKRKQLQDFFSCIYRNSSITALSLTLSSINVDEFGGSLIEGLCGHPSLERLQIGFSILGNIGYCALGKVLKHSASKLKDLCIRQDELDDQAMHSLSDALLGNSTLKKLRLSNNNGITLAGWKALSTVLQSPNCKLVQLDLSSTLINDDATNSLGTAAISSTTLKALNLSSNKSISSRGWQTLLNHLSQSSIRRLDIGRNNINDAGLAALANTSTLKSLDLSINYSLTPSGWQLFFNSLQRRGTQLVKLDISCNNIGDVGLAALSRCSMTMLKALSTHCISGRITSQGWVSFFNALQDSNLDLVRLDLSHNSIDDDGLQQLVPLVSSMSSLKRLDLSRNQRVTPTGWRALSAFLQSPTFALQELPLFENIINNAAVVSFASALAHNKTLKRFYLDDCFGEDANESITERGWEAFPILLCNKTSILDTYNSNHILQALGWDQDQMDMPDGLVSLLELNQNKDKVEVARQKILQTHFSDNDTSKLQVLLDMELEMMPTVVQWVGRPTHANWRGTNVSGLSLMFNLMRRLPDLFDSGVHKKANDTKRKRKADTQGQGRGDYTCLIS